MELRPRHRQPFSGFTEEEIEKMENELKQSGEQDFDQHFCKKLAGVFSHSKGRAGKPIMKWIEVQTWLQNRQKSCLSKHNSAEANRKLPDVMEECALKEENQRFHMPEVLQYEEPFDVSKAPSKKVPDLSDLQFEARSSVDGAW